MFVKLGSSKMKLGKIEKILLNCHQSGVASVSRFDVLENIHTN